jgi:hypothetical protein
MESNQAVFPDMLKKAVHGLDNEIRWDIVRYLTENGETSYTALLKGLKIDKKGKLTFHLRTLSRSAIINRHEILGARTGEKSFYDVSAFGSKVINGLMSAFAPLDGYIDSTQRIRVIASSAPQSAVSILHPA